MHPDPIHLPAHSYPPCPCDILTKVKLKITVEAVVWYSVPLSPSFLSFVDFTSYHMSVCLHVCMFTMGMPGPQKRTSDLLELEL